MATPIIFDLNDPAVIDDPYPHYARLRENSPVHHSISPDLWILSRYDDVARTLRDSKQFSSELMASPLDTNPFNTTLRTPPWAAALLKRLPFIRMFFRTLLTSDAPYHTQLRRKVSRAFTPRRISMLEPRIREITERLVDDLLAKPGEEAVDLVHELASPLPTVVIAEMMGIPAERRHDFKRWSDDLVNGLLTGGSIMRMLFSGIRISVFFGRTIRARRRQPGDDLISLLTTGDEDRLELPELVNFCILLLVAGNETTTNLVTNGMRVMFDRPDLWSAVVADPALAEAVVEETLRFDGPGQGLLRIALTDVTMGEFTIPAGARVLPLIGSANRDPEHWDDPEVFKIDRKTNEHLAFGVGIHYCIGNALARIETRCAIEAIARRIPEIIPAGEPTRLNSPVLRGFRSLPVHTRHKG